MFQDLETHKLSKSRTPGAVLIPFTCALVSRLGVVNSTNGRAPPPKTPIGAPASGRGPLVAGGVNTRTLKASLILASHPPTITRLLARRSQLPVEW